ncbi:MAG: hypothetical protein QOE05_1431 [Actinomycetota bacterium]|jgi:uncharacterized membrane protein|nr:hypothetical protein [Actinomycetota bacterium]
MDRWTLLIAAHAIGATLALMLGGYLVLRRPKGDLRHRRLGRVWVVTMYWVAVSSFGIQELTPGHFSWIHGLSAWTIASLSVAVWAARTGRIRTHRQFVVGSYFGLVGAGLAATAFPVRLVPQTLIHAPLLFVAVVANVALVTAGIIAFSRQDILPVWNRSQRASGEPAPATSTGTSSTAVPTA